MRLHTEITNPYTAQKPWKNTGPYIITIPLTHEPAAFMYLLQKWGWPWPDRSDGYKVELAASLQGRQMPMITQT